MMLFSIFLTDIILKELAERKLSPDKDIKAGPFRLRLVHNKGAFLNIGEGAPRKVAALSVLLNLVLIPVYFLARIKAARPALILALTLILGGGFSNSLDRLRKNYVVDYIGFGNTNYYYNLGDVAIILGAVVLVLLGLD